MDIRIRLILSERRTTSYTLYHHSSASRIPTPPVPLSFPDQKSLKRESLATIRCTPSLFRFVSWRQHRSTLLQDTVSTTSLVFPCIVPTFIVPTRKDFGHSLDSPLRPDPAALLPRAAKPKTLPTTLWLPAPPQFMSVILTCQVVMIVCGKILWQNALFFHQLVIRH